MESYEMPSVKSLRHDLECLWLEGADFIGIRGVLLEIAQDEFSAWHVFGEMMNCDKIVTIHVLCI